MFDELLRQPGVIETVELRSRFGFMAFHGGLEGGTEIIATFAADAAGASLYTVVQPPELTWHVPSAQISPHQSPGLARFLAHVDVVVALHGYGRPGRASDALIGGRNRALAGHLADILRAQLAGYTIVDDLDEIPVELRGLHRDNPVNRAARGGVQLELSPRTRGASPSRRDRGRSCVPAPGLIAGLIEGARTWTGSEPGAGPRRPGDPA